LEDFAHIFTEYGNCFTFNHDENIQANEKVSVSGRGLSLLFNVHQVLNFLKLGQGSNKNAEGFQMLCLVKLSPQVFY